MKKKKLEELLTKSKYLGFLLRKFWACVIVLVLVGAVLGGVVSAVVYKAEYTVTQAFTIKLANHPYANSATVSDNQLSKTIPNLLSSDTFNQHMKPYIRESGVVGTFKVTSLEASNIFYLTVVSDSNENCQRIINDIQAHYGEVAKGVIGESTMKFMAPPAMNKLPSNSPKLGIGILLGALIMLVITMSGFVLQAWFTKTVSSADDMLSAVSVPCLAQIHQVYHKRRSRDTKKDLNKITLVVDDNADLSFRQEISALSTNVDKICRQKDYKSILVTSSVSGEGKSTVSLNLACDMADRGKRVVIVDCDLRVPSIAESLDVTSVAIPLYDAILEQKFDCAVSTRVKNLYLAGNVEGDSEAFERITSKKLKALIDSLKLQFDYVILDSPPVGLLGDAIQIGEIVDGFIYVVAHNSLSKSYVLQSLSSFDDSNSEMLGFVLNHIS